MKGLKEFHRMVRENETRERKKEKKRIKMSGVSDASHFLHWIIFKIAHTGYLRFLHKQSAVYSRIYTYTHTHTIWTVPRMITMNCEIALPTTKLLNEFRLFVSFSLISFFHNIVSSLTLFYSCIRRRDE